MVKEEEVTFLRTLANGIARFQKYLERNQGLDKIDGAFAFELYDTYGFPFDLTQLMAREHQLEVDTAQFQSSMEQQKNRSRAAQEKEEGDWTQISQDMGVTFVGYDELEADAKVLRYRKVVAKNKTHYQLVLDKTPFYAESGGQVGDTGVLVVNGKSIPVWDTKKENDLIVHMVNELPEPIDAVVHAKVHTEKRVATENNHSATHLLHAALREVLGDHVQQRGSLVNHKMLLFDFSHFSKMTPDEIAKVEQIVNEQIRKNISREVRDSVPLDEAKSMGAMALFGEKYGELVRVVCFDKDFSIELCGGTHVKATGQIGLFKIIAESSIASGVRRIEAITAARSEALVSEKFDELNHLKEILKNPSDPVKALQSVLDERNHIIHELDQLRRNELTLVKDKLLSEIETVGDYSSLFAEVKLPNAQSLKDLSFELKNKIQGLFAVLAANVDGKPQIGVVISEILVKTHDWHAGKIVKELAGLISGGGGGQPFFATAGGKDLAGLSKVVEEARKIYAELLADKKEY